MEVALFRSRVLITVATLLGAGICLLISRALGVPPVDGLDISLLNGHSPVLSLLVIALAIIGCAAMAALVVGRSAEEAGLFVAAVGLAVFSVRGGSISATLRYAGADGVFLKLAIELILLYAIVVGGLLVSLKLLGRSAKGEAAQESDDDDSTSNALMAVGVQAITMAVVMYILGHSESKKQALAAVGIAAYLGAVAAHYTFPVRRGFWLAFGPLAVGLVGYFLERSDVTLAQIGMVRHPLATALPIDYASAGIIGGILGHWMSLKWAREAAGEVLTKSTPVATAS